jgi:hypothetical protein
MGEKQAQARVFHLKVCKEDARRKNLRVVQEITLM